jgi:hypothetical protein
MALPSRAALREANRRLYEQIRANEEQLLQLRANNFTLRDQRRAMRIERRILRRENAELMSAQTGHLDYIQFLQTQQRHRIYLSHLGLAEQNIGIYLDLHRDGELGLLPEGLKWYHVFILFVDMMEWQEEQEAKARLRSEEMERLGMIWGDEECSECGGIWGW